MRKVFLFAAIASLFLCSCGGKNPVDEYVSIMESASSMILDAKSMEELDASDDSLDESKAEQLVKDLSALRKKSGDYVLTDKDREKLLEVHMKPTEHILDLQGGMMDESVDELKEMARKEMAQRIADAATLADLIDMTELVDISEDDELSQVESSKGAPAPGSPEAFAVDFMERFYKAVAANDFDAYCGVDFEAGEFELDSEAEWKRYTAAEKKWKKENPKKWKAIKKYRKDMFAKGMALSIVDVDD